MAGFCPECDFGGIKTERCWNYKTGQVYCRWTCLREGCSYSVLLPVALWDEKYEHEVGQLFMTKEEWVEECRLWDPEYDVEALIAAKKGV